MNCELLKQSHCHAESDLASAMCASFLTYTLNLQSETGAWFLITQER